MKRTETGLLLSPTATSIITQLTHNYKHINPLKAVNLNERMLQQEASKY